MSTPVQPTCRGCGGLLTRTGYCFNCKLVNNPPMSATDGTIENLQDAQIAFPCAPYSHEIILGGEQRLTTYWVCECGDATGFDSDICPRCEKPHPVMGRIGRLEKLVLALCEIAGEEQLVNQGGCDLMLIKLFDELREKK